MNNISDKYFNTNSVSDLTIQDAAFLANNVPVFCNIIRGLTHVLEKERGKEGVLDGETENFLVELNYMLSCIEKNSSDLHKDLIKDGYKQSLYRCD